MQEEKGSMVKKISPTGFIYKLMCTECEQKLPVNKSYTHYFDD